ncbi:MAG: metal-dependent hydrolase [Pseudomonadota bacterium]|nr:metal-dependent hydrolase [Pseudomonadota bacterium]
MMAFTHAATGVFIGLGIARLTHAPHAMTLAMLAGGFAGSLLPDIDHPQSWLGRRIPFVSIPLSLLIGHRGATHSAMVLFLTLAGALAFAGTAGASGGLLAAFSGALCAGYASHLAADWLTPSGIPLLWPNPRRFKSRVTVQIGSLAEYSLAGVLWLVVVAMA